MSVPLFVYDLIIAGILLLLLIVLIVNRIKQLPLKPIAAVLIVIALGIYFGRDHLPYPLGLPINNFYISHHNAVFDSYPKFGATRRIPIANHYGDSFYVDGFAGKKMFYDKERDYYAVMDGIIFTPVTVTRSFHANLTWAEAEINIGGELVKEFKGMSESFDYTFSPGFHHVKIRISNVSVTPIKAFFRMTAHQPITPDSEVKQALAPLITEKTNLFYTYGAGQKNLRLPASAAPTVVFLRSGDSVPADWDLANCAAAGLKAIIYSGVGNSVKTDADGVMILRVKDIPEAAGLPNLAECHDAAPVGLLCHNGPEKIERLNSKIKEFTGRRLTGFTPIGTIESIDLPEIVLDTARYDALAETIAQIAAAEIAIKKRHENPYYDQDPQAWKTILHVTEEQIPQNRFRAFYLRLQEPEKVVHTEIVPRIAIKYSNKRKFHNLKPEFFMALWIGDFDFETETTQDLTLAISWAKAKLVIDGETVYDGGDDTTFPYTFSKGKHRIEIEYINNYGQVDFVFGMQEQPRDVGEDLQTLVAPDTKVYLFGTYGIDRSDHTLDLRLDDSRESVVLFVASYEPIHWNIKNAANLKAVVFNSYNTGSSVTTDHPGIPVFRDQQLNYAGRLMPYCYDGPVVHCESEKAFQQVVRHIVQLTGKRPDGFSSTAEPSFATKRLKKLDELQDLLVPQFVLDQAVYDRIELEMATIKEKLAK